MLRAARWLRRRTAVVGAQFVYSETTTEAYTQEYEDCTLVQETRVTEVNSCHLDQLALARPLTTW